MCRGSDQVQHVVGLQPVRRRPQQRASGLQFVDVVLALRRPLQGLRVGVDLSLGARRGAEPPGRSVRERRDSSGPSDLPAPLPRLGNGPSAGDGVAGEEQPGGGDHRGKFCSGLSDRVLSAVGGGSAARRNDLRSELARGRLTPEPGPKGAKGRNQSG